MNKLHDINEDEIRVIGTEQDTTKPPRPNKWWPIIAAILLGLIVVFGILFLGKPHEAKNSGENDAVTDSTTAEPVLTEDLSVSDEWMTTSDPDLGAATTMYDTVINGMTLTILTPHNAKPSLCVGYIDTTDTDIILATQAADIRHDNGKIVGAFVCKGEPKAWGLSKKGYCAIFDDRITVGVADNSPYFEQATEEDGYFFRQYPLVDRGQTVDNNPTNEAQRRSLCQWKGQIHIIICNERVTMNDFSAALAQLGVSNAIYLVGSTAYGWAIDGQGKKHLLGMVGPSLNRPNVNYILFRK